MNRFLQFFIFASLFLGACADIETTDCTNIEYNSPFSIAVDEMYCLPDGNYIYIELMNPSYCPCNSVCVWEGELLTTISYNLDGEFSEKHDIHENAETLNIDPTENYSIQYATIDHKNEPCAFDPETVSVELIINTN
jgi:hypothetical protein